MKIFAFFTIGLCFCSGLRAEHVLQSRHLTTADGLAANTVRHIFQDEEGYLWFSTNNGLSRYDGYSFKNYRQEAGIDDLRIKEVKEDDEHHILISTIQGGYYCLDKQTGHTIYTSKTATPSEGETSAAGGAASTSRSSFFKDERDNLWRAGADGSLQFIMVKAGREFTLPHVINDHITYGPSSIFRVCYTRSGLVAIATTGNGLFLFDPQTEELEHLLSDEQNPSSPLASNHIISIMEDRTGSLWLGYDLMGVTQLQISDEKGFQCVYPTGGIRSSGTDADAVRAVHYDEGADLLVMADKQRGVAWYDSTLTRRRTLRTDDNVYCIAQDPDGGLWLGTRGSGIWHEGSYLRQNPDDGSSLSNNDVYSIFFDREGTLWAGTLGGGLCRARDWRAEKVLFDHFFLEGYGVRRVRSLVQDANGMIWAGTSHGVMVFDPKHLDEKGEDGIVRLTVEDGHLRSNEVRSLLVTRHGHVFISELGSGFAVTQVPESKEGYRSLKFEHFGSGEGLCNDMVQCFGEDDFGKVWISTELGLSRFDPEEQRMEESFFPSLSISGNVFSEGVSCMLPHGRIAFGSNRGVVIIDTRSINDRQGRKPVVHVVEQEVDGRNMSVTFTTFDYNIRPMAIRYSYRLGSDDWSPLSPASSLDLKHLGPGHYKLLVRAVNETGHWSDPIDVSFDIAWPWYLHWWAICLWALLVAGVAWFAFSQISDRMRLRQHIRLQEQLNEAKLVFFTNVSHEFRTPLALIRGALERIRKGKQLPDTLEQPVALLERNSDRLMHLINQLLEFRRMENNVMSLRLEKMDIVGLLRELFESFHDVAEQKHLGYRMTTQQNALVGYFDRSCIDKVVYNLLSNAIKYTPEGGHVELEVRVHPAPVNELTIRIVDDGVGIPEEQRNHLFERFNRSHYLSGSMGIGLNLCAALVEVHHGKINYEPNPMGGSIFSVTLPLSEESYSREDYLVADSLVKEPEAEVELPELLVPMNSQRVLLIEDNDDLREYVRTELKQYFNVDVAHDGSEGLDKVEASEDGYDLIITDIMMPGISGIEVIQRLRQNFNTSHIPIVALTALDSTTSKIKGLQAGVDAYITKPFSTQLLLATIINLMNQRSRLKEKFSADKSMQQTMITTSELDREFLEKLDAVIDKRLSDADFGADDFASEMALGRTIFFRKVKGVTGFSPKEYLRIRRMKKAAALLAEGRLTVSAIAYEVGLKDPFYFSRCFKQQFGMTPTEYVRKVREENL